ncbi:hypothetical protein SSPS47_00495 [Streptomyces sp. S4.7]|nr:hypothetical protein SSPS47_00495 [Streptomyces sp. S4.7]
MRGDATKGTASVTRRTRQRGRRALHRGPCLLRSACVAGTDRPPGGHRVPERLRPGHYRLRQAVEEGGLPPGTDPELLARYLMAMANGMAVQAVSGTTRDELRQVTGMALRSRPPATARLRRAAEPALRCRRAARRGRRRGRGTGTSAADGTDLPDNGRDCPRSGPMEHRCRAARPPSSVGKADQGEWWRRIRPGRRGVMVAPARRQRPSTAVPAAWRGRVRRCAQGLLVVAVARHLRAARSAVLSCRRCSRGPGRGGPRVIRERGPGAARLPRLPLRSTGTGRPPQPVRRRPWPFPACHLRCGTGNRDEATGASAPRTSCIWS